MSQLDLFENNLYFDEGQELKKCSSCKIGLPITCYSAVGGSRRIDGTPKIRNKCNDCYKKNQRQRRHLLKTTPLPDKNYKCPICSRKKGEFYEDTSDKTRQHWNNSWCLDHNHNTGKFRGWLCHKCTSALGWFDDDLTVLKKAVTYLEKSNDCKT